MPPMDSLSKKRMYVNLAIVLLVLLNGMQLAGIFSQHSVPSGVFSNNHDDSTHTPMKINVLNGCGVNGVGSVMTTFCRTSGYDVVEMGNYKNFMMDHSLIIDRIGNTTDALRIASLLGISKQNVVQQFNNDQLVSVSVIIGKDYQSLKPWN